MHNELVVIFDCGATNVRVVAINPAGHIEASCSYTNATKKDPHYSPGLIWDIEDIWDKLTRASREVISKIDPGRVVAVSVTTFGVDGTFMDQNGTLLYPLISWQCQRTHPVMDHIDRYISRERLYQISGVYPFGMNTINKLIWLKENKPGVIRQASDFLFLSSLLLYRLSGVRLTNATMAGTSMLMDARQRRFSPEILTAIGLDTSLFPQIREAGEVVGSVTPDASLATALPEGLPVYVTGHDTQFAIFGSGAGLAEPILSSGTWEILMSRSKDFTSEEEQLQMGITTELDALPGWYNIGLNWMGSGPLEWIRNMFFSSAGNPESYETLISEAEQLSPGSNGIRVNPDFVQEDRGKYPSGLFGLRLQTSRSQIYRAALESLSFKLKKGLVALEHAGGFSASQIICVGGGSKNRLWNQIRADACQRPIQLIDQKETTVLGAALFGFVATDTFQDIDEAREQLNYNPQMIYPSENAGVYQQLEDSFMEFI